MSTPKSAVSQLDLTHELDSALEPSVAEENQRALLNILEDFASEKIGLEQGQRAMLNILDDFDAEKTRMEAVQRSMLNILDDFASEKTQLESAQGAMVNILDDFSQEKGRLEQTQRAVLNILDDFETEKNKVELVNTEVLAANKELEAFSYSVSHDLRAPLRGIDGFSLALLEDYADKLDDNGRDYLHRVRAATQRMGVLIDDLLSLSRVTRTELRRENSDLAAIARSIAEELQKTQPQRRVEFRIEQSLEAHVDPHLTKIALENLLGNAWKFTSRNEFSCIDFGRIRGDRDVTYFVRDNGAGFDPANADRLFSAFQRLHDKKDFPGTGVGLA